MQMLILRNTARSMKPISSFFVSKKRNSLSFDGASNSIVPPKKINNYIVTNENYNETKSKSNNNKNGIGFKEFDVKGTEGMSCEWKQVLSNEFSKPYFQKVAEFVANERNTKTIYPPLDMVHSWSNYCKIDDIKVVIIGQDPYHGVGQAHGLSFSVNPNIKIPASLKNIYKELKVDIENFAIPDHGFLGGWAQQGVLMLNSCLTVEKSKPNSHQKRGWEHLTDAIIQHINKNMDRVVFLLWGSNAKEKGSKIDKLRHLVLTSPHPSPFSADKGFFGCKHFSSANNYLSSNGKPMIDWCQLPKSLK